MNNITVFADVVKALESFSPVVKQTNKQTNKQKQQNDCKTLFHHCLLHLISLRELAVKTNAKPAFKIHQHAPGDK